MKSNFLKNIDYKNLVLTILVTLFVFTFNLKINKPLKMFFLLIALLICIYDLRYLVPFLVYSVVSNLSYIESNALLITWICSNPSLLIFDIFLVLL